MVVCVECLPADKPWDVVSVKRQSSGVAPRACVRVYARVLVPPNLYIHIIIHTYASQTLPPPTTTSSPSPPLPTTRAPPALYLNTANYYLDSTDYPLSPRPRRTSWRSGSPSSPTYTQHTTFVPVGVLLWLWLPLASACAASRRACSLCSYARSLFIFVRGARVYSIKRSSTYAYIIIIEI